MNQAWENWRLRCENGRQQWELNPNSTISVTEMERAFHFHKKDNPNSADRVYRWLKTKNNQAITHSEEIETDVIKSGINFYSLLQDADGHWPGDYGGPMFLTPGLVIASYVTETPLLEWQQALIKTYMLNHQNEDGGWGLHLEGTSTMFGTVLQYVSLRILGMKTEDAAVDKARKWIRENGGATKIPSWGKFYLSVLGVYEWDGCNSLLPELWLMPEWLPIHPSRYWCHARMVYLPMSYCYGNRVTGKSTQLINKLRHELYTVPYSEINWKAARNQCAETDLYFAQPCLLKALNCMINGYEKIKVNALRKKALDFTIQYINAEDEQTNFINIGPVNKVINSIAVWHKYGKNSAQFTNHKNRWNDYLWLAEDGLKVNGYNGSQLWDTVFAAQAILETGMVSEFSKPLALAYDFIENSQVKVEVRDHEKYYRHASVGGWPFSTREHGWPITDCTAEGLKTTLLLHEYGITGKNKISDERLMEATDLILSFQNKDGGWASYELTRSPAWVELLNPSEIFGNIMIDYSYTECTSACVQALCKFLKVFPKYKTAAIKSAIQNGCEFILKQQNRDGSWYGSWAVCYTYGTWFGVEALADVLDSNILQKKSELIIDAITRACDFIVSKQDIDGGWGELFESCVQKKYLQHPESQVVNTSWALLALMRGPNNHHDNIRKGISFIQFKQGDNGDWPQQSISGVFNHNCMISYTSYRNVFPIWALGRYRAMKIKNRELFGMN